MPSLAGNVKGQTDRVLRQYNPYGEMVEYAILTSGAMTITFINKYRNIPVCFTSPHCTIVLSQDANGYYTGATLTPVDAADSYSFMAICSGMVLG